ncbi:MAG: ribulose-phosphate 3-epimerase [Bacillota bacterium]|nr:ribulose-phosphate 3-epimerase [Bacillota bacterium]
MTVKIAPSLFSADFSRLGEEIKRIEDNGADWVHLDVMDGHFVPAITLGPPVAASIRKVTNLFIDAHLMVDKPEEHIEQFVKAGVNLITIQAETTAHLDRTLREIKSHGIKTGVALNPATPICFLEYVWPLLDLVLVMSVNPGAGGQKFIPAVLPKIKAIAREICSREADIELQVDGGINRETASQVIEAGATVLVAGSAIFGDSNGMALIKEMKDLSR